MKRPIERFIQNQNFVLISLQMFTIDSAKFSKICLLNLRQFPNLHINKVKIEYVSEMVSLETPYYPGIGCLLFSDIFQKVTHQMSL
jgi:hypothetical protein